MSAKDPDFFFVVLQDLGIRVIIVNIFSIFVYFHLFISEDLYDTLSHLGIIVYDVLLMITINCKVAMRN